jgi:hypothetical protein
VVTLLVARSSSPPERERPYVLVKQLIFTIRNAAPAHHGAMRTAWIVVIASCSANYQPGKIAQRARAEIQVLGCLELTMRIGARAEASVPVVVVYLGNRCDHSVAVDLSALHVVGGNDLGQTIAMTAYDPSHEIGPRRIDGRAQGEEWIELDPTRPIIDLAWLDVDIGAVAPDEPIAARWVRIPMSRSS